MLNTSGMILSVLSLLSVAAGFDIQKDSCTPVSGTFKFTSPNYLKCTFVARYDEITSLYFKCGERGDIHFDWDANTVRIAAMPGYAADGELTFHGSCNEFGKQISHIGLHIPLSRGITYEGVFPGMTKHCNVLGRGITVAFHSYTLTGPQLEQCALHPVKPIPFE